MPTPQEEVEKQMTRLLQAVAQESSRSKIILFATQIDECLETLLKKRLKTRRAKDEKNDELFRIFAPASSFAARISLAYRLGLISRADADAFDVLRDIRNDCAHKIFVFRFDKSPHKEQLARFAELTGSDPSRAAFILGVACPANDEECLIYCCMLHIIYLNNTLQKINQVDDHFSVDLLGWNKGATP